MAAMGEEIGYERKERKNTRFSFIPDLYDHRGIIQHSQCART